MIKIPKRLERRKMERRKEPKGFLSFERGSRGIVSGYVPKIIMTEEEFNSLKNKPEKFVKNPDGTFTFFDRRMQKRRKGKQKN